MTLFSGGIKVTDLNDYIAPSQACVVSLQGKRPDEVIPLAGGRRSAARAVLRGPAT